MFSLFFFKRARGLGQLIRAKNIKTIGDLSTLTASEIKTLPIRSPKVFNVKKALRVYHEQQVKTCYLSVLPTCILCTTLCAVFTEARTGRQMPWNSSYRCLWAVLEVLRNKPMFSEKPASACNCWPLSPAQESYFNKWFIWKWYCASLISVPRKQR